MSGAPLFQVRFFDTNRTERGPRWIRSLAGYGGGPLRDNVMPSLSFGIPTVNRICAECLTGIIEAQVDILDAR